MKRDSSEAHHVFLTPALSWLSIPLYIHFIRNGPYGVSGEGERGAEPVSARENCFDLMFSVAQLWGKKINIVRWVLPNFTIYQEFQAVQ